MWNKNENPRSLAAAPAGSTLNITYSDVPLLLAACCPLIRVMVARLPPRVTVRVLPPPGFCTHIYYVFVRTAQATAHCSVPPTRHRRLSIFHRQPDRKRFGLNRGGTVDNLWDCLKKKKNALPYYFLEDYFSGLIVGRISI